MSNFILKSDKTGKKDNFPGGKDIEKISKKGCGTIGKRINAFLPFLQVYSLLFQRPMESFVPADSQILAC